MIFVHRGLRNYRHELFERLAKEFPEIVFIFTASYNKEVEDADFENAKFKYKILKEYHFPIYRKGVTPGIIKDVLKHDIVIVSDTSAFTTHYCFILCKLLRKKILIFDEQWRWPTTTKFRLVKPLIGFMIRHMDACIVAGTKAAEWYKSMGVKPERIFIATNTAVDYTKKYDKKKTKELIKRYELQDKEVISYIGRIVEYKGLDVLIKAFKKVEEKNKKAFLVVGGKGPFQEHCKKLAKQLKVKNIKFIGYVPYSELPNMYELSDVFVLPSRFMDKQSVNCEAWGLTLNEALAMGTPVISTTAVGAAYDLIKNDLNGYMVQENNVNELAEALLKALQNKEKLKKNARRSIIKKANYKKMTQAFIDAIRYVSE